MRKGFLQEGGTQRRDAKCFFPRYFFLFHHKSREEDGRISVSNFPLTYRLNIAKIRSKHANQIPIKINRKQSIEGEVENPEVSLPI